MIEEDFTVDIKFKDPKGNVVDAKLIKATEWVGGWKITYPSGNSTASTNIKNGHKDIVDDFGFTDYYEAVGLKNPKQVRLTHEEAEYILESFERLIGNIGEITTEYHWREFAMCAKILQDAGTTNTLQVKYKKESDGQIEMPKFKTLYKQITKTTDMSMLRCTDLETAKEQLMMTELFEGVEEFIVPPYSEDIHRQYFNPEEDKLNKNVEIFNIGIIEYDGFVQDGWALSIVCRDGDIIKPIR